MNFRNALEETKTISDVFELVKELVFKHLGIDQAGIMVGLSDLGKYPNGFIGAYYSPFSNMIVINNRVLQQVRWSMPELYKPYLFHLLLHEYVHSMGFYNEEQARALVLSLSEATGHEVVILLAEDIGRNFPALVKGAFEEPVDSNIYFVRNIDRKNINYIY